MAVQARPYWPHIGLLLLCSLLTTPLSLLNPVPLKLVVDCVLGDHELPAFLQAVIPAGQARSAAVVVAIIAGILVVIALIRHSAEMGNSVLRAWIAEKLVLRFRSTLFRHVQNLSLSFHDMKGAADTAYRNQYDAPAVRWIMADAVAPLTTSSIMLVAMVVILVRIDWQIALVALVIVPALYFASTIFSRRLKRHWRDAKELESAANSVVNEVLGAVRVVKAFAAEEREQARFENRAGRTLKEQMRLAFVGSRFSLAIGLTMAGGTALVLYLGTRHVQAGIITLGDLVLIMSYVAMLYGPLETLTRSAGSLQGSIASAERAFSLLDEAPEVAEKPHARRLARARGHVVFENVEFSYREDRPALRGLSFDIAPGSRVGIAGHTGAGKSTLMSLLLRLYDPTAGSIRLDGVDLRDYALADLRNQFAIVLQEPVLFSASIGDNIAYARPEATREEVIAAARAANVHDFIAGLEKSYDTPVGERGMQLSGGERQRISLARAFLKDAPVLVLDEPTSSVDVKTEAAIIDDLERLMKGRTSFMIAHRLATLDLCDVRLELAGGRLTAPAGAAYPTS
ncbi:MAG: ABC transporter ATP-binding protein [Opitutaceae bacterium]